MPNTTTPHSDACMGMPTIALSPSLPQRDSKIPVAAKSTCPRRECPGSRGYLYEERRGGGGTRRREEEEGGGKALRVRIQCEVTRRSAVCVQGDATACLVHTHTHTIVRLYRHRARHKHTHTHLSGYIGTRHAECALRALIKGQFFCSVTWPSAFSRGMRTALPPPAWREGEREGQR